MCEVPWDTSIFGFNVAQINALKIFEYTTRSNDWQKVQNWLDNNNIHLVSCRLPHHQLKESLFLESQSFRFIEMVLHPHLNKLQQLHIPNDNLIIVPANKADIPSLLLIAENAFKHERYHVDPRLDRKLGDLRYGKWVENSFHHPTQCLLKILNDKQLLGFFIVEYNAKEPVYWHLTAIAPQWQGMGYGLRVWKAMLKHHQEAGYDAITTTISARNSAVLNLYAKLDFRFLSPDMTFHWIRDTP
jgi:RimJ/RimL family protein N-acetyltransferase